ncbi:toprim domain-containing protein [Duncaniella muris]|uniref:toprim domain-containing protein n=1 Tax=Duncaniella muris TaxID=2094150 RepID=UPI0026EF5A59|nr:toprim domain-containing protein [Duncaniella muris]
MSSATESYKDQMRRKLQECKSRVGVTDVALKLGYRVDKSAGVNKYVELILGAPAEPSDRIIVHVKCDKANQTYFRRNGTKGDVVTLIKENMHAFHATGNTEWAKVMNVLADMANMPMTDYQDAEMIHNARTSDPHVFDPSRYDVRPIENETAISAILAARGFNRDTVNAFRPFMCEIRDRSNDKFNGYNIGFPYRIAGHDKIEGYEIRGSKGFKSKAVGTNSSTAAWIADFSNDNPLGVKNVFFMESAFDAIAFYQANKYSVDWQSTVLVSCGGGTSGKSIEKILTYFSKACAVDCFDNDPAGRDYGNKLFEIAGKLSHDYPGIQSHCISSQKAPDGFKDWNDVILGKTMTITNYPSKHDRNAALAANRNKMMKL